jgi:hypothetical protein
VPQSALQFKFRQNFTGLVAGNLYGAGDDMGVVGRRWLGIDNYLVKSLRRNNKTIANFGYFRFVVSPIPVRTIRNEQ